MDNVIERIAHFADIDTRRAMGFGPRKLPPVNLPINFNYTIGTTVNARPSGYFFMRVELSDRVFFYKNFLPRPDRFVIEYMWFHEVTQQGYSSFVDDRKSTRMEQ